MNHPVNSLKIIEEVAVRMSVEALRENREFKKILGRNLFLPLLLTGVLAVTFLGLTSYQLSVNKWVDHADLVIAQSHKILNLIVDAESGARGFRLTGEPIFLEPYNNTSSTLRTEFETLRKLREDDVTQQKFINSIVTAYDSWNQLTTNSIKQKLIDRNDKSPIAEDQRSKVMMDGIRKLVADLIGEEDQIRHDHAEEAAEILHYTFIITLTLSSLGGLFLTFTRRKQLVSLASTYETALMKQKEQNAILEDRNWISAARSGLTETIMGDISIGSLSSSALDFLAKYLGAQVGTFFVLGENNNLERTATHAIRDHPVKNATRFKIGEGLVGLTAQDKKIKVITDLPGDYLKVASSLGETSPAHLILVPLISDRLVKGVIELGFLKEHQDIHEEVLAEIGPPLAAAVKAAQYRLRLEELLSESQQLTEELQSQQEELRVSNEELEENAKMLKEVQFRLENQHAELEQTNDQLEEQTRGLEARNESLLITQRELAKKSQELEAASQYKSEFLANMSHELRTPLNSTLILAKLLAENPNGTLTSEQVEFANTIYSSGNDLLSLINDILDLSKVEAGHLEINLEPISLHTVARDLEKTFGPLAKDRGLDFIIEKDPSLPQAILSDRLRLEQILKNLLSNAVKFTATGSVKLKIERRADSKIGFSVVDSGIGIPEELQHLVFEAFRQADGTTSRKYGGTGLGLTISRDLAKLLGGTLELKSQKDKGSTFTLVLPEAYADQLKPQSLTREVALDKTTKENPFSKFLEDDRNNLAHNAKTVLVIEDDLNFAKILSSLAKELQFKVLVANSAEEGFALALSHSPAGIILDMKLPDHTGLSVLDRLKKTSKTRHIPVHVLSVEDYSDMALKMGAIGYMIKPLERESIRKAFIALESKINQKIKKILIVEDDGVQLSSMQKLIEGEETKTVPVQTGNEALVKLKGEHFDCMIIDLNLPDMSGFELLEKMSEEEGGFPPVIVYTGRSLSLHEEEKLRKYSQSVIIKGARSPERLLDEVSLFIHQVESQLPTEHQRMLIDVRNREKSFENRKILIVDDDVRNIFALTSALEQKGAKIETARNGLECLEKLKTTEAVELILMDLMMPVMDGLTAIKEIRKDSKFSRIPIIAITAKAMKDDQEKSLEAGACDYMPKPVNIEKLMSLIRVWIPKSGWQ
jgi:signal transduction histidine kinase/DNA-binding response OmpR family regulator/CHASE3 domain sensor protein